MCEYLWRMDSSVLLSHFFLCYFFLLLQLLWIGRDILGLCLVDLNDYGFIARWRNLLQISDLSELDHLLKMQIYHCRCELMIDSLLEHLQQLDLEYIRHRFRYVYQHYVLWQLFQNIWINVSLLFVNSLILCLCLFLFQHLLLFNCLQDILLNVLRINSLEDHLHHRFWSEWMCLWFYLLSFYHLLQFVILNAIDLRRLKTSKFRLSSLRVSWQRSNRNIVSWKLELRMPLCIWIGNRSTRFTAFRVIFIVWGINLHLSYELLMFLVQEADNNFSCMSLPCIPGFNFGEDNHNVIGSLLITPLPFDIVKVFIQVKYLFEVS